MPEESSLQKKEPDSVTLEISRQLADAVSVSQATKDRVDDLALTLLSSVEAQGLLDETETVSFGPVRISKDKHRTTIWVNGWPVMSR